MFKTEQDWYRVQPKLAKWYHHGKVSSQTKLS